MTDYRTNLPLYNTPIFDINGNLTEVWWRFFQTILDRTGGLQGLSIELVFKTVQGLDASYASTVPVVRGPDDRPEMAVVPVTRPGLGGAAFESPGRHGQHYDPTLHALATQIDAGFMSPEDKKKLDDYSAPSDSSDWAMVAKADLPAPAMANRGWRRFVTDATGSTGIVPAYCTGTAWKLFSDDSTVN